MDNLPDDVARVVEELLGPREIGALGCASKRWRPDEKIWERVAKRDPLTRCAVVGHFQIRRATLAHLGRGAARDLPFGTRTPGET